MLTKEQMKEYRKVIKEFKDSSKCIKVSDDFMVKLKQRIKEQNG